MEEVYRKKIESFLTKRNKSFKLTANRSYLLNSFKRKQQRKVVTMCVCVSRTNHAISRFPNEILFTLQTLSIRAGSMVVGSLET